MHNLALYLAQTINVPLPQTPANSAQIKEFVNIILSISGAAALLVITMAGFRFTASRGNPQQVSQARDAIIYSCIGLVVIMSAFVIVNFVVFKVK
jgi:hypothetical protein